MDYMSSMTGRTEEELFSELSGEIFKVPSLSADGTGKAEYQTADVCPKLILARYFAENDPEYTDNVKALEAAQPEM